MTQFSAKEPSLGYHYQVRYALYLLLKSRDKEEPFVKLENLDDVEIGDLNRTDLHQTKFHNKKAADLTDSSVDIWKTIRVWCEMVLGKRIDLDNVLLLLITTSEISGSSILNKFNNNKTGKTNKEIVQKLEEISKKSKNTVLKASFDAFNQLTNIQKEKLVKSIYIQDKALSFDDLKKSILKELQLVCLPEYTESIYHDLEGWWYEQCIKHLLGAKINITLDETRRYIVYLNDRLKSDNLPIDKDVREAVINENDYDNRVFINQLKSINIGQRTLMHAKRDFYRASEQRSRWLREKLLDPHEEISYDFRLKDDWDSKFAIIQDSIDNVSEDVGIEMCKNFYNNYYVISSPLIFIRPRVTDAFIVKGSCHMLADKQHIIWHPTYLKK